MCMIEGVVLKSDVFDKNDINDKVDLFVVFVVVCGNFELLPY